MEARADVKQATLEERRERLPERLTQMSDLEVLVEARDCLAAFRHGHGHAWRFALNLMRPRVEQIMARLRVPHHVIMRGQLVDMFDDVLAESAWDGWVGSNLNESRLINALERGMGALLVTPPPVPDRSRRRIAVAALALVVLVAVTWLVMQRPLWMVASGVIVGLVVVALIYWWLTRDLLRRVALTSLGAAVAVLAVPNASLQVHDGARSLAFELNGGSVLPALGFMVLCGYVLRLRARGS